MSHSFLIQNVSNLSFQSTLDKTGIQNLLLTDDSPQPDNNTWPRGNAYLYIDQISVRPVEISYDDDTFCARIFANSSPRDYELAIKLIAEIASQYGAKVEPEDNTALDVESFLKQYDNDWIKDHCTSMVKMLISSFQQEPTIYTMAGTVRSLQAGPRFFGQVLADPKTAISEFFERFRMLNYLENHDFFVASGIKLQNQSGDLEVVTSVYGPDVDTILSDSADTISVRCDGEDNYFVSLDQLAEALGDKAVWLSENVLLAPAVKENDWDGLLAAIKPVAKTDIFEFGKPAQATASSHTESYKARFTQEEWHNLLYSPVIVFALVASADGSIDKKEIQSFQQQLIQGLVADNPLMQELMMEAIPTLDSLMRDVLEGSVDPKTILEGITAVVDTKLSVEDAMQYKLTLLHIGKSIAESSGGFLGMFGSKISKEEMQSLAALTVILKLEALH